MKLILVLNVICLGLVQCQDKFDVMKTSNVTFPYSEIYPKILKASF